ncbi:MAG: PH domain-containing protein [Coriobacteriia bacterium]|nr:PH domain-containing protein [Coriobacteriia bacterium]
MSYIERELNEGEKIVLMGRVSWWTIVPQTLLALGIGVVAAVTAGMLGALVPLFWFIMLPLVLVLWLAVVARQILRVLSTEIAITDRRVMSKTGILRTEVKTTPLDKVNNVNVSQSFFGNMLGYGDIEVTTATADTNDNHSIKSLAHSDRFRNTLTETTSQ